MLYVAKPETAERKNLLLLRRSPMKTTSQKEHEFELPSSFAEMGDKPIPKKRNVTVESLCSQDIDDFLTMGDKYFTLK